MLLPPLLFPPSQPAALSLNGGNDKALRKLPRCFYSRRDAMIRTSILLPAISHAPPWNAAAAAAAATDSSEKTSVSSTRRPFLDGIANTKSWSQYIGDGFSIRVPPLFDDVMEPEVSASFTPLDFESIACASTRTNP